MQFNKYQVHRNSNTLLSSIHTKKKSTKYSLNHQEHIITEMPQPQKENRYERTNTTTPLPLHPPRAACPCRTRSITVPPHSFEYFDKRNKHSRSRPQNRPHPTWSRSHSTATTGALVLSSFTTARLGHRTLGKPLSEADPPTPAAAAAAAIPLADITPKAAPLLPRKSPRGVLTSVAARIWMELPHPRARRDIGGACGLAAEGWGGPQERHGGGGSSAAVPGGRGGRGHLWITLTCYIHIFLERVSIWRKRGGEGGGEREATRCCRGRCVRFGSRRTVKFTATLNANNKSFILWLSITWYVQSSQRLLNGASDFSQVARKDMTYHK